jgi:hypothetical protein
MYNKGIQNNTSLKGFTMNEFDYLIDENLSGVAYEPTSEDWAEYNDYLDSIGYDHGDDDWDEDPDENHGFQNGVFDNIIF